ncbi:hypothetical protein [Streptomyces sparsogenes]|uniref:hypothetical protein n=1 Tax=Streptomyces sparsogenes TaxID=67365 RepID=UPI0033E37784
MSDRLLNMVAPKRATSAFSCWQNEWCVPGGCSGGRDYAYRVDPCNDQQGYFCGYYC